MKLSGVFSVFFVLVAHAYAGRLKNCNDSDSDSSSSCKSSSTSSSEVEHCDPLFAECFKPRHESRRSFERCEPCEPPRHEHRNKGTSRKCKKLLCDVNDLVGSSYTHIRRCTRTEFGELVTCTKRSLEKTGGKAVGAVAANMAKLENDVVEIVREPLQRAMKKIEGVIVETNKYVERSISEEFKKYNEKNSKYFGGLIGLADAALLAIIKDIGKLLGTVNETSEELQRGVSTAVQNVASDEMRRIHEVAEELAKDVEKEIRKAFRGSEALVKPVLEKIFEKEGIRLERLIKSRSKCVESCLHSVDVFVGGEIEKAISCFSSSKERDCKVIRTKLAMFNGFSHHHGDEECV